MRYGNTAHSTSTYGQRRWGQEKWGEQLAAFERFKDEQEEYAARLDIEQWRKERENRRSPWVRRGVATRD